MMSHVDFQDGKLVPLALLPLWAEQRVLLPLLPDLKEKAIFLFLPTVRMG